MTFGIPQIIVTCCFAIGLLSHLFNHGKVYEGKYNFISEFITVIIAIIILHYGGFF